MKRARKPVEKVQVTFSNTVETQQTSWVQAPDGTWHLMNRYRTPSQGPLMACGALVKSVTVTREAVKGEEWKVRPEAPEKEALCPGCAAKATSGDLLIVERKGHEDVRFKYRWPTLCRCSGCGGYRSVFSRFGDVKRPDLAFELALMQHAVLYLGRYANKPPSVSEICQCEARLPELLKAVEALPWMDRGEWVRTGGNAQRGINNFTRVLQFTRQLTEDELTMVQEWLQKDKCPGYTGVHMRLTGHHKPDGAYVPNAYTCTTTWDSSD